MTEVFSSDSYLYHVVLNEMLRRGHVSVVVAMKGLLSTATSSGSSIGITIEPVYSIMLQLHHQPVIVQCIETIIDRSIDFVHAAVAERSHLG
jgi:hypothetical protein